MIKVVDAAGGGEGAVPCQLCASFEKARADGDSRTYTEAAPGALGFPVYVSNQLFLAIAALAISQHHHPPPYPLILPYEQVIPSYVLSAMVCLTCLHH